MKNIIFFIPFFVLSSIIQANEIKEPFSITVPQVGKISALSFRGNDTWYDSNYWVGKGWTRIGKNWQHPDEQNDAIRTFVVPKDGNITIAGTVKKLHLDGDGVVASILHNDKELWKKTIDGKDNIGVNTNISLVVKKGETLRFVVNKRKSIKCDTTGWNPTITYQNSNEIFNAETAFSNKQGNDNWYYETNDNSTQTPTININLTENNYKKLVNNLNENDQKNIPDFEMIPLIIEEWLQEDNYFANPIQSIQEHLNRTAILDKVNIATIKKFNEQLARITADNNNRELKELYLQVRLYKRLLLFSDSRMKFGELLFVKARPTAYSHLVGQYFGWNQRPGGGIYVLEKPGVSLKHRNLIEGKLPAGHVLEPRLSYDAKRIAFSFVAVPEQRIDWRTLKVNEEGSSEYYYHLYEMDIDGANLRQLTAENYDDMMPEYLPDGGLAFISSRRKGYSRCFGAQFSSRWHSYTLHRMDADNNGNLDPKTIIRLSNNDVSEWFPQVANDGHLWFARWDYIDRDAVTHQNLWATRPDGTNPIAIWGNAAPKPHCMFQAKPIPKSNKIVFIASAHHSITAGPICILDPSVDANSLDAITRLTSGAFPEAESKDIKEYYNSPYPLGDNLFLASYSREPLRWEPTPNPDNALGLYLLDNKGNREIIYRDKKIGATCPLPIISRHVPPIVRGATNEALAQEGLGEMSIVNVYEGLGNVKKGSLKQLRVVQIFPKTTAVANSPRIGVAGEENTRAVLGVVPIEADGSAKFLVPVGKPLLFQVLDEDGLAYQTMRSTTSVMSGEQVSCIGCHENKMSAAVLPSNLPIAFSKPATRLTKTPESGKPYGFVEMVQPIFNAKCVSCHNAEKADGGYDLSATIGKNGYTASYRSLCRDNKMIPRFQERNQIQQTIPGGKIGARGSKLIKLLKSKHADVTLTAYELERIGTWIDLNAVFYGTYDTQLTKKQQKGEQIPMPTIE
ncbi:MAG: hypothetical protein LBH59_06635 [Planctomycetaceae bacterium]|jgi:hypothetical protein|nr:hypothetical protein [Planctomycetaceae bacterium]